MSELRFLAQAPSNIALVKYMGKKEGTANLPENPSLSMTLDSLCTWVELSQADESGERLRWIPEVPRGLPTTPGSLEAVVPALKGDGVFRVERHRERIRPLISQLFSSFGLAGRTATSAGSWVMRTANTFPQDSGIASSASSFAAVTTATAISEARNPQEFMRAWETDLKFKRALAAFSRQGSGSSCRSFEGPWVCWDEERTEALPADLPRLTHFVLLVSERSKKVSSSEAHQRVKSSPLWEGRVERATQRVSRLQNALACGDLPNIARIAWTEAWEMHSLFHTCTEPFSYWEPRTIEVLHELAGDLKGVNPPIVTLDAGPNVHVTVERSRAAEWVERFERKFPDLKILRDESGMGASLHPHPGFSG